MEVKGFSYPNYGKTLTEADVGDVHKLASTPWLDAAKP